MKINKELLKGSTGTLVLSLLEKKPMYGYEMIKTIEQRSEGVFAFKEGTLYPILHALEAEGYLQTDWSDNEGRKRKYYTLTEAGRKHLAGRLSEWRLFQSSVNRVLGEDPV